MGLVLIKNYSSLSYGPRHDKFACSKSRYDTFQISNNRLHECSGLSVPLLFANPEDRFFCVKAHMISLL